MQFRVSVTERALEQMNSATEWYGQRDRELGRRWHDGLERANNSLAENPEQCGFAHESDDLEVGIHELLYGLGRKKTHRILFRISEQTVEILAVRHVAQQDVTADDIGEN